MTIHAEPMSYLRKKIVAGNVYIYEVAKVKRGHGWVQEIVRYVGPEDPAYGGKGPVNIDEERAKLKVTKLRRRGA